MIDIAVNVPPPGGMGGKPSPDGPILRAIFRGEELITETFFAVFFAGDFLAEDFFGEDFLAADFFTGFRDELFFFATLFRVLFLAAFLRAGRLVALRFLPADFFFAALFLRGRLALFFRAGVFRRAAFFAFLRPFFAAIGCLQLKIYFPATTRSPRRSASRCLKRDAISVSPAAAAASARSSRLCGVYNR